jgi:hypothetical protein
MAMLISAALLAAAAVVTFVLVRTPRPDPVDGTADGTAGSGARADRVPVERFHHCGIGAPPAHPVDARR